MLVYSEIVLHQFWLRKKKRQWAQRILRTEFGQTLRLSSLKAPALYTDILRIITWLYAIFYGITIHI